MNVVILAGGFGGARMAHGFALLGDALDLSVVVNTGDDLEVHGLHVSPDLDTVMYTLAGLANNETGWGVRDETWSATTMLERYGAPSWFRIGDRDLATHVGRTKLLRDGRPLSTVAAIMARALGVSARLLPMSDERVRTQVRTADGWLDFQDYFVRRHHADDVLELRFDGVESSTPAPGVIEAIAGADLIVVAPSNPFLSVAPILSVPGILPALLAAQAPVMGISPIVSHEAVRGPAAQIMRSLGGEPSAAGVARHYAHAWPGLLDVLVIDQVDRAEEEAVNASGVRARVAQTLIGEEKERRRLAQEILELAGALPHTR
ncbi:MAG TPA: 2-phospho-L-lactate transferase [Candidatus Limnocylindrales bacterium]